MLFAEMLPLLTATALLDRPLSGALILPLSAAPVGVSVVFAGAPRHGSGQRPRLAIRSPEWNTD
jgi:hypothetical protein